MGQGGLPNISSDDDNPLEKLLKLELMKKALQSKSEGNDDIKKMSLTLEILYASIKLRILSLANKLAFSQVCQDTNLVYRSVEVPIPKAESWDFHLGDWVRIKYSMSDFKHIQSTTLGWNPRLHTIHSIIAVVTKRWSCFENGVQIFTPSRFSTSTIYGGLLEKIPDSEVKYESYKRSRWQPNDYVTILLRKDDKTVDLMQKGLDNIPERYFNRRGRVIAVTALAIVVTFNERTSCDVNPSLLSKCSDQQSPLDVQARRHTRGFELGQKVIVNDDIKLVIKNQSGHGGWAEEMTKCLGKEVTIIHIRKNGNVMVQYKLGRSWMMNPDSLRVRGAPAPNTSGSDPLPFKRGDVVKIKLVDDIRDAMRKVSVPTAFLEYLRTTAEVKMVQDDFDYLIKYNCNQNVNVISSTIRMVTTEELSHHNKIKSMVKEIAAGSSVYLDVGPPAFVRSVLQHSAVDQDIIEALTTPSVLVGFDSNGKAVIEVTNGKRYRIKKKYLTVPDKFNMKGIITGLHVETIKEIQEAIAGGVRMLSDDKECIPDVKILSMSFDGSPFIDLRVCSSDTSLESLCANLIDFNWEVTPGFDNSFYASGMKSFDREIKISVFFNDEPYFPVFGINQRECDLTETHNQTKELTNVIRESATSSTSAEPIHELLQQSGPQVEQPQLEHPQVEQLQVRDPQGVTLRGVKYLRLSGNVYLPLCIGELNDEGFNITANSHDAGNSGNTRPSTVLNLNECSVNNIKF